MKKRRYKEKEREKERTNCSSKVESTKPTKSKKWEEYVPINTVRVKKNFFFGDLITLLSFIELGCPPYLSSHE